MRRVLHVGPANSAGGMATVMRLLGENPPDGWHSQTIATHCDGSLIAKILVWRRAKREIRSILRANSPNRPNVVHIHSAADWSFARKSKVMRLCKSAGVSCILHIHSGKFDSWLGKPSDRRAIRVRKVIADTGAKVVVLSDNWAKTLNPLIGQTQVIVNPIVPVNQHENGIQHSRNKKKILLMGRPAPVKGASLAIAATRIMRANGNEVTLHLTGVTSGHKWSHQAESEGAVIAHGWLSDQELEQLRSEVGLLLVPSAWEGQPMVILEALARGIPMLVSPVCAEHVGAAGRVVDSKNPDDWAQEISTLLADSQALDEMSAAGIKLARSHEIEVVGKQWQELYESL